MNQVVTPEVSDDVFTAGALNEEFFAKSIGIPNDAVVSEDGPNTREILNKAFIGKAEGVPDDATSPAPKMAQTRNKVGATYEHYDPKRLINGAMTAVMAASVGIVYIVHPSSIFNAVTQNAENRDAKRTEVYDQSYKHELAADHFGQILTDKGIITITAGNCEIPLSKQPDITEGLNSQGYRIVTGISNYRLAPHADASGNKAKPDHVIPHQSAEELIAVAGLAQECQIP